MAEQLIMDLVQQNSIRCQGTTAVPVLEAMRLFDHGYKRCMQLEIDEPGIVHIEGYKVKPGPNGSLHARGIAYTRTAVGVSTKYLASTMGERKGGDLFGHSSL